jgi:hypothetical protein
MTSIKSGLLAMGALALTALSACGGGDSSTPQTTTDNNALTTADQAQANLPADGLVVVGAGSTALTRGTYTLHSGGGSAKLLGSLTVGYAYGYTGQLSIVLSYPQDQESKFIVAALLGDADANASSAGAALAIADVAFACVSSAWRTAEVNNIKTALGVVDLPTCPSTVSYTASTKRLTLNQVTLNHLQDSTQTLVISLDSTWVLPSFPVTGSPTSPSNAASVSQP